VATAIYDNCYTCRNGCPTDGGDIGGRLSALRADADGVRLCRNPLITDVNVVTTRCEIWTRSNAQRSTAATRSVVKQRIISTTTLAAPVVLRTSVLTPSAVFWFPVVLL